MSRRATDHVTTTLYCRSRVSPEVPRKLTQQVCLPPDVYGHNACLTQEFTSLPFGSVTPKDIVMETEGNMESVSVVPKGEKESREEMMTKSRAKDNSQIDVADITQKHPYFEPNFIGTYIAICLGALSSYAGFVMPATSLSLTNADIGTGSPLSNIGASWVQVCPFG